MIAVVGGITRNDQTDGWNVKAGRASGVGESEWHTDYIMAFQVNDVSSQLFRDHKLADNLTWKARTPKRFEGLLRCLLAHHLNHFRPRDETGTRKSFEDCTGPKEMIAVAMRGVDRRQILATRHDPIHEGPRLLDRNRSIDEDSVALPRNKG